MRQFSHILVVVYVILGIGTGLVHYAEREKKARSSGSRDELALDAVTTGLLWPFYIFDVLAGHDSRKLS